MENKKNEQNLSVELTKELYLKISADKATKIAVTRKEKDDIISKISGRIDYLRELRAALKEVKVKIRNEKKLLRQDKKQKFALTRELVTQNAFTRDLNNAYTNGEQTVDLTRFYTAEERKTR